MGYYNIIKGAQAGGFTSMYGGLVVTVSNMDYTTDNGRYYTPPLSLDDSVATIAFPDGNSESIQNFENDTATQPFPISELSSSEATALLQAFKVGSSWKVAKKVHQVLEEANGTALADYIYTGTNGSLIIGMTDGNSVYGHCVIVGNRPPLAAFQGYLSSSPALEDEVFPARILVIQGEVAYEYLFESLNWTPTIDIFGRGFHSVTNPDWGRFLTSANYQLNRMLNRYGDVIQFPVTSLSMEAAVSNTVSWTPADGSAGASISMGSPITYNGGSEAFTFQLSGGAPGGVYPWIHKEYPYGRITQRYSYYSQVTNATGESIKFNYQTLSAPSYSGLTSPIGNVTVVPETGSITVLSGVTFPGKQVGVHWDYLTYAHNFNALTTALDHSAVANVDGQLNWDLFPHWSGAVTSITETDMATNTARTTVHTRQVPQPYLHISPPTPWVSTDFYDVVNHPDGSVTITSYVEPSQSSSVTNVEKMRLLAYLKHQAREIREYAAPTGNQTSNYAMTDFLGSRNAPTTSAAYKITFNDRWDVHGVANAALVPSIDYTSVPHPTRTRVWDKDTGLVQVTETYLWDATNRGYTTTRTWITADTSTLATTDYLATAFTTPTSAPPDVASFVRKETETLTLGSVRAKRFWDRVLSANKTVDADTTTGIATGFTYPFSEAQETKTYEDTFNKVTAVGRGPLSGYQTSVAFTYGPLSVEQAQLKSAVLTGYLPSGAFKNSTQAGASYTWDPTSGFMATIKPNSMGWNYAETRDAFGLVQSQTDPNGKTTSFAYDGGGRLTSITPPTGLQGTSIIPDSDSLGMQVLRGLEGTWYRFNGFGELILEKRSLDGGTTWTSHRNHGYDAGGRRTGTTVWNSGPGNEGDWAQPNLVQNTLNFELLSPGEYTYDCLTNTYDAYGNCLGRVIKTWAPPVYSSTGTTVNALSLGTVTNYDGRGRVIKIVQPTDPQIITTYDYSGFTQTVTVGSAATMFTKDAVGRTASVKDAGGNVTKYRYTPVGRISQVIQQDGSNTQIRTWSYNPLGWLNQLVQPESGTTQYPDGGYTVTGKAMTTVYGVGTAAPKTVTITPDRLDRPLMVSASDASVKQAFSYDQGTAANASNGKVLTASDGGTVQSYTYGGLGGELTSLGTTIWSGGDINSGDSRSFNQQFSYDSYGNRSGGNTGQSTWSSPFDLSRSLPSSVKYGALTVLTKATYDDTNWNLLRLDYGNNASTIFSYGPDQVFLATQNHLPATGAALATWSYKYDERGNMLSEKDVASGMVDQYGYDILNRLKIATVNVKVTGTWNQYVQNFIYDGFGNRTVSSTGQAMVINGTPSVLYSSLPKQVQNVDLRGTASLAARNQLPPNTATGANTGANYDVFGNLTNIWTSIGDPLTQVKLTYDALGRVTSLLRQDGTLERYGYTPQGLRTFIEETSSGLLVKRRYNIYNDLRQLVSQHELVLE